MNKKNKVLVCVCAVSMFSAGFVSAQSNIGDNSVLENIVAHTDAWFVPITGNIMDQMPSFVIPAPSVAKEESQRIHLVDVTKSCTNSGEVISAYPDIYKMFRGEENRLIIRVYSLAYFKGGDQRIEVYYTGGDWMQYGLVYLITNAGKEANRVRAYYVKELSTSDQEDGAVAPIINPFDAEKLEEFIISNFLDLNGNVKGGFREVASISVLK